MLNISPERKMVKYQNVRILIIRCYLEVQVKQKKVLACLYVIGCIKEQLSFYIWELNYQNTMLLL